MAKLAGTGKKVAVWGIFGLLIVGLGGFGTANFGGSVSDVGSVGDRKVDINTYANGLQNEMNQLGQQIGQQVTVAQAQQLGLPARVLGQLFNQAALDGETDRLDLSVGDDAVRSELINIPSFQGLDGTFDADAYRNTLSNVGQNPTSFEESLREDLARTLLQGALTTGITMPDTYGDIVVEWLGERRTITVATLGANALSTGTPVASEEDLQAQYTATPAAYTAPQTRDLTYVWLSPDMLTDKVELDEANLRQLYNENIAQYVQSERRLVERLVFGTLEEAQAAAERLATNASTFEEEISARGLDLVDADMGDVSQDDLDDAGAAVFSLDVGATSAPLATNLGPALFRVNGVLDASEISFEQARADLATEMAADAARRDISDMIEDLDDLLASGATLEELADETDMQLGTLSWTPASEDGIASYSAFVSAAEDAEDDDFPSIIGLSDGGVFALRLDSITPETLQDFDSVRAQVTSDWETAEMARLMLIEAQALESQVASGTAIVDLGLPLETFDSITRQDFISTMPDGFIDAVFAPSLAENTTTLIQGNGVIGIAHIDAVLPPENTPENAAISDSYINAAAQGAAQDVIAAFSTALRTREGLSINQAAIDAVHAQLP